MLEKGLKPWSRPICSGDRHVAGRVSRRGSDTLCAPGVPVVYIDPHPAQVPHGVTVLPLIATEGMERLSALPPPPVV